MRYFIFLLAVLTVVSCGSQKIKPTFAKNVVVAHRGAWKTEGLPQNSIAALKHAIALKCTGSEFDVWMTADDSLIVTHDRHYNNLLIEETSYTDLATLKLSNGEELPTLRNYILAGLENNPATRLVCEIKPSKTTERGRKIAEKTLRLVNELSAQDMTIYISFDYGILKKLEVLDSKVHTQYLKAGKDPEEIKADGIDGVDYNFNSFKKNPQWIDSAKENNMSLNVWTVNKSGDMDWFWKMASITLRPMNRSFCWVKGNNNTFILYFYNVLMYFQVSTNLSYEQLIVANIRGLSLTFNCFGSM